jgi:hypothetical protein
MKRSACSNSRWTHTVAISTGSIVRSRSFPVQLAAHAPLSVRDKWEVTATKSSEDRGVQGKYAVQIVQTSWLSLGPASFLLSAVSRVWGLRRLP